MTLLKAFCGEVEAYLAQSKLAPTAFGIAAVGDPNFVFDLRSGREPRAGTIDKVREFVAANAPQSEVAA